MNPYYEIPKKISDSLFEKMMGWIVIQNHYNVRNIGLHFLYSNGGKYLPVLRFMGYLENVRKYDLTTYVQKTAFSSGMLWATYNSPKLRITRVAHEDAPVYDAYAGFLFGWVWQDYALLKIRY